MHKYQISQLNDGRWCCVDLEHGITITWVPLQFNDTQRVSLADTSASNVNPMELASLMSSIGDWLNLNFPYLLYPMTLESNSTWVRYYIASVIREAREQQGLSIGQLCDAAGISRNMIARIEDDKGGISMHTLSKLLYVLDLRIKIEPK